MPEPQYTRSDGASHRPAWTAFYRRSTKAAGVVGLFHETYVTEPGAVESLYVGIPVGFGLGGAVGTVPLGGALASARQRRERRTSTAA